MKKRSMTWIEYQLQHGLTLREAQQALSAAKLPVIPSEWTERELTKATTLLEEADTAKQLRMLRLG